VSNKLVVLGAGYSAQVLMARLKAKGWQITATARSEEKCAALTAEGYEAIPFDLAANAKDSRLTSAMMEASHILHSIAPEADDLSDGLAKRFADLWGANATLKWFGYLSTVGVYGDHLGAWVDEQSPCKPNSKRSKARVAAEKSLLALNYSQNLPVHIFRLAGIYGPLRGPMEKLQNGTARRIIKAGQVFNRIHVEDIATVLEASIARPRAGAIYNVADDMPAPPQDVLSYGAQLLGLPIPEAIPFAAADMSPMGRSFYSENKRVDNALLKSELGVKLAYPNFYQGLKSLL